MTLLEALPALILAGALTMKAVDVLRLLEIIEKRRVLWLKLLGGRGVSKVLLQIG